MANSADPDQLAFCIGSVHPDSTGLGLSIHRRQKYGISEDSQEISQ